MAGSICAAVVSKETLPYELGTKPIIPDHKVYFVPSNDEDSAHFLCAMLNSEPIKIFINSFTVKLQVGTLFRHVNISPYDPKNKNHQSLVSLSKKAHIIGINSHIQNQIDELAWALINEA